MKLKRTHIIGTLLLVQSALVLGMHDKTITSKALVCRALQNAQTRNKNWYSGYLKNTSPDDTTTESLTNGLQRWIDEASTTNALQQGITLQGNLYSIFKGNPQKISELSYISKEILNPMVAFLHDSHGCIYARIAYAYSKKIAVVFAKNVPWISGNNDKDAQATFDLLNSIEQLLTQDALEKIYITCARIETDHTYFGVQGYVHNNVYFEKDLKQLNK